jgi:hypothetical protein
MAALPEAAPPTNGAAVAPLPPDRPPGQWLVVGPRTRQLLARGCEGAPLGVAALVALLEASGAPDGQEYALVIDAAHLEPAPPRA